MILLSSNTLNKEVDNELLEWVLVAASKLEDSVTQDLIVNIIYR